MNENNTIDFTSPDAHLESHLRDAALSADRTQTEDTRVDIHVRSFRRLKHDPDGVSVKAAIDGIVGAGILTGDSSKQVKKVTFESFTGGKEEITIIDIIGE